MTVPAMAALELLPAPPQLPPRAPGPFAFEEADYVDTILQEAGYADICISPLSRSTSAWFFDLASAGPAHSANMAKLKHSERETRVMTTT